MEPLAPPPVLGEQDQAVAAAVVAKLKVQAITRWHLNDQSRVDGIGFCVGAERLGHLHLHGSIHLATTTELGAELAAEDLGRPFS